MASDGDRDGPLLDVSRVASCFDGGAHEYEEVVWRNRRGAERLIASLPDQTYDRVLDVGCGTGFASVALLDRFQPRAITGVDASGEMLERFRSRLSGRGDVAIEAYQADVLAMPIAPETVDLVLTTMAFHWFPDRLGAMKSMATVLSRGGVIAILTGCEGTEEEYRQSLLAMNPPVPEALTEIYSGLVGLEEMDMLFESAGFDPIDIWIEQRRRVSSADHFVARMRLVAGHLIADRPPAEQDEIWERIGSTLKAGCGEGPFVYHFNKLYATGQRP